MLFWELTLSSIVGLTVLGLVYQAVLFNAFESFGGIDRPSSYFDSPFWAGAPYRRATVALQGIAILLYLAWTAWSTTAPPPEAWKRTLLLAANVGFYLASVTWPYLTYRALERSSKFPTAWMWSACVAIWLVAASVIALMVGSASPQRWLLLPLAILTSGVDGILWTVSALGKNS